MAGKKGSHKKPSSAPIDPPAHQEDDELVDDLLATLDARNATVQEHSAATSQQSKVNQTQARSQRRSKTDSKSRFKAREMRKAAARAAQQLPVDESASERIKLESEEETRAIREICDAQGLEMHEINADGHCLFAAVADQLAILSILPAKNATYHATRRAAADYIAAHPDDFVPFLSTDDEGRTGTSDTGLMSPQALQNYCATIRDTGAWGGEPEILAMARAFDVSIHVVQRGTPSVVIHSPNPISDTPAGDRVVRVSYHRRLYGLGEHYNSLRPKDGRLTIKADMT